MSERLKSAVAIAAALPWLVVLAIVVSGDEPSAWLWLLAGAGSLAQLFVTRDGRGKRETD